MDGYKLAGEYTTNCRAAQPWHFWHLDLTNFLYQPKLSCAFLSVHSRIFSGILGFYRQRQSHPHPTVTTKNVSRDCPVTREIKSPW